MSLTPAETLELHRLLAKAKSRPGPPSDDEGVYDPQTGVFVNPETGEVLDVWTAAEDSIGAMTDGSKRREDMLMPEHAKRAMKPRAKASSGGQSSQGPVGAYASSGVMSEAPFPELRVKYETDQISSHLPPLPEGVPDVETWGFTLIEFGQFKNASMSYHDLVSSSEERPVAYVKWCRSRSRSATGQLKDLCDYLTHYFSEIEEENGPIIPGTGMVRRLKK